MIAAFTWTGSLVLGIAAAAFVLGACAGLLLAMFLTGAHKYPDDESPTG